MNINQLEYFVTTIKLGSFSAAAREMFVTPQAISKAVGDLEKELHVQLFRKVGRGIAPTEFGSIFAERAAEILFELIDLEHMAKNHSETLEQQGSLSLALTYSAYRGNVMTAPDFDPFEEAYPSIYFTLQSNSSGVCLSALEEGVVDAALILGRTARPNIECTMVTSRRISILVSNDHPLSQKDAIGVDDLQDVCIGMPEDLRYCFNLLTNHLSTRGYSKPYKTVPPYEDRHHRFIFEEMGALFVIEDPTLNNIFPNSKQIRLTRNDELRVPFCFVHRSGNDNKAIASLERYLFDYFLQES